MRSFSNDIANKGTVTEVSTKLAELEATIHRHHKIEVIFDIIVFVTAISALIVHYVK